MIKAIIFDLDDTLYSEQDYVFSGFKSVAKYISDKCNLESNEIYERLIKIHQTSTQKVFDRLVEDKRFKSCSIKELLDVYRNHIPKIELFKDVIPVIEDFKYKGYKIGLVTDGYKKVQRNKILGLNIENYFDQIVVTDELGKEFWKPHPRAFELIKEILKVDYNQMVYVGDNPQKDFYIGSIYPINTIRIDRKGYYNNQSYYKGIKENIAINSLLDLQKAIDNLNLMEGESNE